MRPFRCKSPNEHRRHLLRNKRRSRWSSVMKMEAREPKSAKLRPGITRPQSRRSISNGSQGEGLPIARPRRRPLCKECRQWEIIQKIKKEIKKSSSSKMSPRITLITQMLDALNSITTLLARGDQMRLRSRSRGTFSIVRKSSSSTDGMFSC